MPPSTKQEAALDLRGALRKAFNFGQTYWQQADSESFREQDKSSDTVDKFAAFVNETCAALDRHDAARAAPSEPVSACQCEACDPPPPLGRQRMYLCETCGNKRCPHATDHRNACTNSNEPGQHGSSYGPPGADIPAQTGIVQGAPASEDVKPATLSEAWRIIKQLRAARDWKKAHEPKSTEQAGDALAIECIQAIATNYFHFDKMGAKICMECDADLKDEIHLPTCLVLRARAVVAAELSKANA